VAEFEVAGKQYRSAKMNAFQQFHVARKLGPIFAKLGPNAIRTDPDASLIDMLEPVVDALAAMPEEDCNYILFRCLAVVQRGDAGRWTPIWNENAKRLMFEDIDMSEMIQICMQVLGDNLGPFIAAPGLNTIQPQSPMSDTPQNSPA
jgi:hypothetical protein